MEQALDFLNGGADDAGGGQTGRGGLHVQFVEGLQEAVAVVRGHGELLVRRHARAQDVLDVLDVVDCNVLYDLERVLLFEVVVSVDHL